MCGGLPHPKKILLQDKIFKLPKTYQNTIKLLGEGVSLRISRTVGRFSETVSRFSETVVLRTRAILRSLENLLVYVNS
jgi:hypothetical protein